MGWIAAKLLEIWHEHHIFFPITITIILAYSTFLLAEDIFHVSGVVAVLLAAITFAGKQHLREEDEQKIENARLFGSFWNYISTIANSFLFFALGSETGAHPFKELGKQKQNKYSMVSRKDYCYQRDNNHSKLLF